MIKKSGVEKFMVEMSGVKRSGVEAWGWKVRGWDVLQPFNNPPKIFLSKILKSGSLFNLLDEFAVFNWVKYILSLELDFQFSSISAYIRLRYSQIQYGILE